LPELPEVETVRRGLEPAMEGARIIKAEAHRPDLRFPLPKNFAKRLTGATVTGLGRRAKYIVADLSSGEVLLMHLGMSGSFRVEKSGKDHMTGRFHHPRGEPGRHDHVVFEMSSGFTITFNDPRRFGFMKLVPRAELENEPLLRGLGPEPLGNRFDAATLAAAVRGKKTSLKAALLDQTVVAGLGNIYVAEALFRAHLSPRRPVSILVTRKGEATPAAERLTTAIKHVLNDAVAAGGSSLRNHRLPDGDLGRFHHYFRVYDREGEPCPTPGCKGKIRRIVQNGRSTFYCPSCQR
jgi:formamidopyrimidine-DNA glycosylase